MLQQTQALRVIPKWRRSSIAYPTPAACAAAPLGDVLRLWQGLGYPRRAQNLHAAADADRSAWASSRRRSRRCWACPASAIHRPRRAGVRVRARRRSRRHQHRPGAGPCRRSTAVTAQGVQAAADSALPRGESWAWNQCLMDLGAVLCRPVAPRCDECPLRSRCAWRGRGEDPAIGSAGVSKAQARFDGSDRQARGRLMKALVDGSVSRDRCAGGDGLRPPNELHRLIEALTSEGLVVTARSTIRLP